MTMRLRDLARVIRSKNAGPTLLSIDLMFATRADFDRAAAASALRPEAMAALYGVGEARVTPCPAALALKIVIPRRIVAGSPGDGDVYGAQQHGPLLDLEL